MATIPILNPTTQLANMPAPYRNESVPGAAFGTAIGEGLQRLGAEGLSIGLQAIDHIDQIALNTAHAEARQQLDAKQPEIYARQGIAAQGAAKEFSEFTAKLRSKISEGLNPRQQQAFMPRFDEMSANVQRSVDLHTQNQLQQARVDGIQGALRTTVNSYAQNISNGAQTADNTRDMDAFIAEMAAARGMEPAAASDFRRQIWSDAHATAVERLLALPNSATQADAYLKAHEKDMDAKQYARLSERAQHDSNLAAAQFYVDKLDQTYKDDYGAKYDAAEKDKSIAGAQLNAVRNELAQRESVQKRQYAERDLAGYDWVSQNRIDLQTASSAVLSEHFSPPTVRSLLAKQQVDTQKKLAAAEAQAKAAPMARGVLHDILTYDTNAPVEDLAATVTSLTQRISEVEQLDKEQASMLKGELAKKREDSRKIDPSVRGYLYADKNDKGSLAKQLIGAVKDNAKTGGLPFNDILDEKEASAYAARLLGYVRDYAAKNPTLSRVEIEKFAMEDSKIRNWLAAPKLKQYHQYLTGKATDPWAGQTPTASAPTASTPAGSLIRSNLPPIVINLDDPAVVSRAKGSQ